MERFKRVFGVYFCMVKVEEIVGFAVIVYVGFLLISEFVAKGLLAPIYIYLFVATAALIIAKNFGWL